MPSATRRGAQAGPFPTTSRGYQVRSLDAISPSNYFFFFFAAFLWAFFLGAAFFTAAFFFLATVRPPKKVSARSVSVTSRSQLTSSESHPEQKHNANHGLMSHTHTSCSDHTKPINSSFRELLTDSCTNSCDLCNRSSLKSSHRRWFFQVARRALRTIHQRAHSRARAAHHYRSELALRCAAARSYAHRQR
jgi:hypothetical protein